jgi:non-ribosomal peptide synthetase component F
MGSPSANGREPKPGADGAPPISPESGAAADVSIACGRIGGARPLSVLKDASPLRWRYGERLDDVIEDACRRFADLAAVAVDGVDVSFRELDARANQMARYFIEMGVKPGDRVAVLLDRGSEAYAALLALMKARATYVPLDANHPPERLGYILRDASASLVVAHFRVADRLANYPVRRLILDRAREQIAAANDAPYAR